MTHIVKEVFERLEDLCNVEHFHPFISENIGDILIFDIETTGLHHKNCAVILIGYLYVKNNQVYIEQLFAETPDEEYEILQAFNDIASKYTYLLSYNGNSFDIPFLNSRFKYNQLEHTLSKSMNIDLLRVARLLASTLNLENYKLKTVERFLGIYREDTISGKDSVDLYNQYVRYPTPALKEKILLHNYEDILYLGKVIDLLGYQSKEDYSNLPLKFNYNDNRLYILKQKINKDFLSVELFSRDVCKNALHFLPGQLTLEQVGHSISLKIPIFSLRIDAETLRFIDVDLITEKNTQFNALSVEEKMNYYIESNTLHFSIRALFHLLNL